MSVIRVKKRGWKPAKASEDITVSMQGHGLCILQHARNFTHRISSEGPDDHQRLLHYVVGAEKEMAWQKKTPFHQYNAPIHKSVKLNVLRFKLPPPHIQQSWPHLTSTCSFCSHISKRWGERNWSQDQKELLKIQCRIIKIKQNLSANN